MLDQLKRLMDEAGRDYAALELIAMSDPTRLTDESIKCYRDFGVKTLFTVPLSRDPQGILSEVREFGQRMKDAG